MATASCSTSKWLVFLIFLPYIYGIPMKRRVENLEMQVNSNYLQTRRDILELQDMISDLNSTGMYVAGIGSADRLSGAPYTEFKKFVDFVETFMNRQSSRTEALSRAFIEEKATDRKIQDSDVVNAQTYEKSEKNLKASITSLSNQIIQESSVRQTTILELQTEVDALRSTVADCKSKLTQVDTFIKTAQFQSINQVNSKVEIKQPCLPKWFEHKDKCYYFVTNETVIWEVANWRCHDFGGILAEPETAEVISFLKSKITSMNISELWIGATDTEKESTWIFTSSKVERLEDSFQWASGQPNSYNGDQDCLELAISGFNDEGCSYENNYVCQRNGA